MIIRENTSALSALRFDAQVRIVQLLEILLILYLHRHLMPVALSRAELGKADHASMQRQ